MENKRLPNDIPHKNKLKRVEVPILILEDILTGKQKKCQND